MQAVIILYADLKFRTLGFRELGCEEVEHHRRKCEKERKVLWGTAWGLCCLTASADGCSNRYEMKCHQHRGWKRPADSLYKHWYCTPRN